MYIPPVSDGKELENVLLGISEKKERNYLEEKEREKGTEEIPFHEAVKLVKKNQPPNHNPRDPQAPFLRQMYQCVAHMLKKRKRRHLFVYIAVGSYLDRHYGTDFFFECDETIVTVDVTLRPGKSYYKAKILITSREIRYNEHYKKARQIGLLLGGKR